jgi:hypothetical protein
MIRQCLKRSPGDATRTGPGALPRFEIGKFTIKIK